GNDDFTLGLMHDGAGESEIGDYVAWTLAHAKCLGLKVINAGGSAAFKFNARSFGLDDVVPAYGVTSRAILQALQPAVTRLGVPHPVHVHCNNLGIAGNVDTAIATMDAAEACPCIWLTSSSTATGPRVPKGWPRPRRGWSRPSTPTPASASILGRCSSARPSLYPATSCVSSTHGASRAQRSGRSFRVRATAPASAPTNTAHITS